MQKRSGAVVYFPSALVRYLPRHMPGGRIRRNAKTGSRRTKKRRGREARRADRCSARNLGSDPLLQIGRMTVSVAPSV
jgi:hypothetical protein